MIIYFWNKCQKMSDQLITVLNEAEYCLTEHMLNITYYYLHEILICIFLTFSYFWGFTLVSIKKIVSFTFLRYFNLKVEYKGVLSIFLFLLVWSWSIPYLTILATHSSKFPDPPLALFLKRNHPKKYQVSKRFFYKKQVFINWFM